MVDVPRVQGIEPARAGDVVVSFTISPDGEAVVAWASAQDSNRLHARDTRNGASFARRVLDRPATLRVTVDGPGEPARARVVRELSDVTCCFPNVHRLPGEALLVVGGRAAAHGGNPDHNALVFGADDRRAASGCVGDGVQSVSVTAGGAIWIGYFDEGVCGNYGWGENGIQPIGAAGLNRFDADLTLRWSHPVEGEIFDCYAMTTTGEDCWVCPYTEWPILRIGQPDRVERWRNSITGAHAMLASGTQVALIGGYSGERDRVVIGSLERGVFRQVAEGQLTVGGQPWSTVDRMCARDGMLHALAGGCWHASDLWRLFTALA
jgi:hypothetical protein